MSKSPDNEFALQRDCIVEAASYLAFEDNWRYNPAVRIRRLLERFSDSDLKRLGYPSTAIQLLLGGNIWPQAQYLNFVRHTAFFFVDLLDNLQWQEPREALSSLAVLIEDRIQTFRLLFKGHIEASELRLPADNILSYWGRWYIENDIPAFSIRIIDDPRPYNMNADKLRDIYHYDCAVNHSPQPTKMIVANTGFTRNVRTSFTVLSVPIICAEGANAKFFL